MIIKIIISQYSRDYYLKNREKILSNRRRYRSQHRSEILKDAKSYRESPKGRIYFKQYREKNQHKYIESIRKAAIESHRQLRLNLLSILGCKCMNPRCLVPGGCMDMRCLQLDHINGGGCDDRRRFKYNEAMYRYYIKHLEEAREKLQVLCANCNWIKVHENNECKKK